MMTAEEMIAAWKAAAATGNFYGEFKKFTGFSESDVKKHFAMWNNLRHETAEEIADSHGMTIREGGFQVYLAIIKQTGHPPIEAIVDEGPNEDPNPRPDKPWPESEDCKGCGGRDGAQYQHRFGCPVYGARASTLTIPVRETSNGHIEPLYPVDSIVASYFRQDP